MTPKKSGRPIFKHGCQNLQEGVQKTPMLQCNSCKFHDDVALYRIVEKNTA